MTSTTDLRVAAERRMNELYVRAEALVARYRENTFGASNAMDEYESTPMIYPTIRKTKRAFAIDWFYVHEWTEDSDGKWIARPRRVPRKSDRRMKFGRYAEDELVVIADAYEHELDMIRREIAILVALKKHNRRNKKLRKAA